MASAGERAPNAVPSSRLSRLMPHVASVATASACGDEAVERARQDRLSD